ncbi:MAG: valine--tRNA ligase [Luteibaculaceae bacterium]
MEIPKTYNPELVEDKWYAHWMEQKYFKSVPDNREPYTIVIPPPNVTGVLHMGHMLNNTIQDVLIRKARMQGKNACWVPGTDHASIATEAKVVAKLKAEGIDKNSLSREEFLKHAWAWTDKHGGIILEQLKKLGASCDWDRTAFTLDEPRSSSVIKVFVELYNKGLIYRGYRMVNWDPEAKTTVSDEEVIYKDVDAKLYYVQYPVVGSAEKITIATTRPETILADVAICVNPNDTRFAHLVGKEVTVPLTERSIKIIADAYVDMEFGTGCLKITPAHDPNDKTIGEKFGLPIIDMFNDDATANENGLHYQGKDRFVIRKEIAKELEEKGFLLKAEPYKTSVGTSERTGAVIEPKISVQWFLNMQDISKPALDAVTNGEIKLIPNKFVNTYKHWMENVTDWCISRQLWWGHQIPAWYFGEGINDFVVANTAAEALHLAQTKTGNKALTLTDLKQDPDALDTWFSSWLWPMAVFDGINNPDNAEFKYYYPTNDLVTAPEILFFWVARMILAGYLFPQQKPFTNVYLTGIVRDKLGRKMSKSLGNSPDPLDLIKKYGADGVRVGMLLTSPAGNDLPFDESLCEQGRNFNNKIWNATRLLLGFTVEPNAPKPETAKSAELWFQNRFNQKLAEIEDHFSKYRLSDALMAIYKLAWDDFCSWYLEMIKPPYGEPIDAHTHSVALQNMELVLKLLHPFMPFISEEIWHLLRTRKTGESICVADWSKVAPYHEEIVKHFELTTKIITEIRNFRSAKGLSPKEPLSLFVKNAELHPARFNHVITKLANVEQINENANAPQGSFIFVVEQTEYAIPFAGNIDVEAEKAKIEAEILYEQGFLAAVDKKLSNEKFVGSAPEKVVELERKKKADCEARIALLTAQLKNL